MRQGIHIYNNKPLPNIDWPNTSFDYKFLHYPKREEDFDIGLNNLTTHWLQCSTHTRKQINNYLTSDPKKVGHSIKHIIVFNEVIVNDSGSLLPRWWDIQKAKAYIERIRDINPDVKLWISNHKLLNPMYDRTKKRELMIELASELGLDGVGMQVWLDWKIFCVPGHYLESIIPSKILSMTSNKYDVKNIWLRDVDKLSNVIDPDIKPKLINFFSKGLVSYILEFGQAVKEKGLLFSVPEWAVFLTDQERQYEVAKQLLDTYQKIGTEFNCYWYLSDDIDKKQPGKEGLPGLLDKDYKPKKIASLFAINTY